MICIDKYDKYSFCNKFCNLFINPFRTHAALGRLDTAVPSVVVEIAKEEHKEVHDSFDGFKAPFNLAMVFVENPIHFDENVTPICIPEEPKEDMDAYKSDIVRIPGMGLNVDCTSTLGLKTI